MPSVMWSRPLIDSLAEYFLIDEIGLEDDGPVEDDCDGLALSIMFVLMIFSSEGLEEVLMTEVDILGSWLIPIAVF